MLFKNENYNIQDFFKTNHEINSFKLFNHEFRATNLIKRLLVLPTT